MNKNLQSAVLSPLNCLALLLELGTTSEAAEEEAYHELLQLPNALTSWLDFHQKSGKRQGIVLWEPVTCYYNFRQLGT